MIDVIEGVAIVAAVAVDVYAYTKMKDAESEYERVKGSRAQVVVAAVAPVETKAEESVSRTEVSFVQHVDSTDYAMAPVPVADAVYSERFGSKLDGISEQIHELEHKVDDHSIRISSVEDSIFDLKNEFHAAKSSATTTVNIEGKLDEESRIEAQLFRDTDKLRVQEKTQGKQLKKLGKRLNKVKAVSEDEIKGRVSKKVFSKSINALKREVDELRVKRKKKKARKAGKKTISVTTVKKVVKAKTGKKRSASRIVRRKVKEPVQVKVTTTAPVGTDINTQIVEKK